MRRNFCAKSSGSFSPRSSARPGRAPDVMAGTVIDPSTETESVYVVGGNVSPELITKSLQALLPTRHHPMARQRFTMLDTFDGRIRRAGARLTRSGMNGSATIAWQPRGG